MYVFGFRKLWSLIVIPFKSPRIIREENSFFSGGKTCNVVKTGIPKVRLDQLYLDNAECVRRAIGSGLADALTNFGPDQLEIVRFSNIFQDVNPTAGRLESILLHTNHAYRAAYPGRSLISCDPLDSTKYPPDPVRLSDVGLVTNIQDSMVDAFVFNDIQDI